MGKIGKATAGLIPTFSQAGVIARIEPFPFLLLPQELRQLILFNTIVAQLKIIDDKIAEDALEMCDCKCFVCTPSDPYCQDMSDKTHVFRYRRVREFGLFMKIIDDMHKQLEEDIAAGWKQWLKWLGGVKVEGKGAQNVKGKKAFMLWVFETAGVGEKQESLNASNCD